MADWQVEFLIIPRRALVSHGALDISATDVSAWSTTNALPADYQKRLGAVASAGPSPSEDLQTWGPPDGNRIEVRSENGRVSAVKARVDVRRLDSTFGAALLQFVRTAQAVLVRSDGLVVEPQIAAYANALRSAPAWRFANDPAEFIRKYRDTGDDET
jgi:hypothetical protein